MQKSISLSQSDIDRIIEMAWEDRTTFDAIESQYGLKEQKVKELMRENLKTSSYRLWIKRVNQNSRTQRKKFEYSRKLITSKVNKGDYL